MGKVCVIIVALAALFIVGADENWRADTARVDGLVDGATVYTKTFAHGGYENLRVVIKVNDTVSPGFVNDSVSVVWGVQTIARCRDANGKPAWCPSAPVAIDTILTENLGVIKTVDSDSTGIAAPAVNAVDTLLCSGFATQSRDVSAPWDSHIRVWLRGITGNKKAIPVRAEVEVLRRIYVPVGK